MKNYILITTILVAITACGDSGDKGRGSSKKIAPPAAAAASKNINISEAIESNNDQKIEEYFNKDEKEKIEAINNNSKFNDTEKKKKINNIKSNQRREVDKYLNNTFEAEKKSIAQNNNLSFKEKNEAIYQARLNSKIKSLEIKAKAKLIDTTHDSLKDRIKQAKNTLEQDIKNDDQEIEKIIKSLNSKVVDAHFKKQNISKHEIIYQKNTDTAKYNKKIITLAGLSNPITKNKQEEYNASEEPLVIYGNEYERINLSATNKALNASKVRDINGKEFTITEADKQKFGNHNDKVFFATELNKDVTLMHIMDEANKGTNKYSYVVNPYGHHYTALNIRNDDDRIHIIHKDSCNNKKIGDFSEGQFFSPRLIKKLTQEFSIKKAINHTQEGVEIQRGLSCGQHAHINAFNNTNKPLPKGTHKLWRKVFKPITSANENN